MLDKSPPLRKSMRHELSLTMSGITGRRPSKVQLNLRHRTSQQFGGVRKRDQTIGEGPVHRSFESAGLFEFAAVAFWVERHGFHSAPGSSVSLERIAHSCIRQNAYFSKPHENYRCSNSIEVL